MRRNGFIFQTRILPVALCGRVRESERERESSEQRELKLSDEDT